MLENLSDYKIVLASNSPRRRELLSGLGIDFLVRVLDGIDESYPSTCKGEEIPIYISSKKAEAYRLTLADDELLITADTIVYVPAENETQKGEVLGKPKDVADAYRMLKLLSGRSHQVITGVSILTKKAHCVFAVTTDVTFSVLSDEEINFYIEHYKPFDKAGAYGIQEWIGYVGVKHLNGSYFNVMGLPVQRLYEVLKRWPALS